MDFRQMDNHLAWEEKTKVRALIWSIKVKHLDQDNMMSKTINNPLPLQWEQSKLFKKITEYLDPVSIHNDPLSIKSHKELAAQT